LEGELPKRKKKPESGLDALAAWLSAPAPIHRLAAFRIAFGGFMAWEMGKFFRHDWVDLYFVAPKVHFTYLGFGWVRPLPGPAMYVLFGLLALAALCVATGMLYRVASTTFFVGFTYVLLLEQSLYVNHLYLFALVSLLLIFMPAHAAASLDARRRPALRSLAAPAWTLWTLRLQFGLVYFYGGLAKLSADWLAGEPMGIWLERRGAGTALEGFLAQDWLGLGMAYGGLLYDLLVVPLLLWRRTRWLALLWTTAFHLINVAVFGLGVFPWVMLVVTWVLFPPRCLDARLSRLVARWTPAAGDSPIEEAAVGPGPRGRRALAVVLVVYFGIQVLLPFRHYLYPGHPTWTGEAGRFSWHMKLRDIGAEARFVAVDPASGARRELDVMPYMTRVQYRRMRSNPEMIHQLCRFLARELAAQGEGNLEVRAFVMAALNGRAAQPLIDPEADLGATPRTLGHAEWIVPLTQPLP
jgi:hypothetical protein